MINTVSLVVAVLVLAAGTFAFRVAGPLLRERMELSERFERLIGLAALVLLGALVVTQTFLDGLEFAGYARPAGVVVGGLLAWFKVPFLIVVLAAAGVTAGLRWIGVP